MIRDLLLQENYTEIDLEETMVGHFEIKAMINDIPVNLILDTGAAGTVIDLGFAESHNLPVEATGDQGGGLGTSAMDYYKVQVSRLAIGAFILDDPDIYAMDFQHVKQALLSKGIDNPAHGVLGADILIPYKAIIDYADRKLYLKQS